jgi:hypothetical protein
VGYLLLPSFFTASTTTNMRLLLSALLFQEKFRKPRYWSAIGLSLLVVILGSIRGARADIGRYASGPMLHFLAYAILTLLIFSGSAGTPLARASKAALTVMILGAIDETVQNFFSFRDASVIDWGVDCSAAAVTALMLWSFRARADVPSCA